MDDFRVLQGGDVREVYTWRDFNAKLSDLRDNLFVVQPEYLYLFIEIILSVHIIIFLNLF